MDLDCSVDLCRYLIKREHLMFEFLEGDGFVMWLILVVIVLVIGPGRISRL